eukprot:TRINITY_DN8979_c0_g1_i2.p2 TRINITY_DN8979_c0_g1~~TRINITY_DN8979_c0_g1_i2.p2  ORF type:complete len:222 (+),score=22.02 TRINITY_DN8979_c0_g1_i2:152-817(+)
MIGIKTCYEECIAGVLNMGEQYLEKLLGEYKMKLFDDINNAKTPQVVLEIGIGNGPNLKYFTNPNVRVIGVDINRAMLRGTLQRVQKECIIDNLDIRLCSSEDLPLQDSSVDHVVVCMVLCSVKNVDQSLKEIVRVLKPGGTFHFIEHVISAPGSIRRFWQHVFSPFQQFFTGGCHLDRDLLKSIERVQLDNVTILDSLGENSITIEAPLLFGRATCSKEE